MYAVKKILYITVSRKIYDIPDDTRKIHGAGIPSLGGIGIFIGFMAVASFFWPGKPLAMTYFLPPTILLFFTGVYDDLMNMRPSKKLLAQLVASAAVVYFADIRIVSLQGIMGIEVLPYWISLGGTVLACTLFINAFNFVDGIDGLACILAITYTSVLGMLFAIVLHHGFAIIAFSMAGATLGLLVYNFSPARIYMGDTGSMLLGFTIFVLSMLFVNIFSGVAWNAAMLQAVKENGVIHSERGALLVVLSLLFLPVFDALRVFVLRAARGKSPLNADRAHLHYYLLDAGFTHTQAVMTILGINVLIIAIGVVMQDMNPTVGLVSMAVVAGTSMVVIYVLRQKKMAHTYRISDI
jgi:UDP-N-acetylmuramyl pentapeptide phosphotransferase/UDP-N-acetylglucosamine-1-phosphate transferase